jgi:hypothetical protein
MSEANGSAGVDVTGLRERLPQKPEAPQKAQSPETAQEAVKALNEQEAREEKDEKDKKTYGRTPDGTGAYFKGTRPSSAGLVYSSPTGSQGESAEQPTYQLSRPSPMQILILTTCSLHCASHRGHGLAAVRPNATKER